MEADLYKAALLRRRLRRGLAGLQTVGEMCNLLAMTYLQQEDFAMVLELLKKAEILTERDPAGRAVTFNNQRVTTDGRGSSMLRSSTSRRRSK